MKVLILVVAVFVQVNARWWEQTGDAQRTIFGSMPQVRNVQVSHVESLVGPDGKFKNNEGKKPQWVAQSGKHLTNYHRLRNDHDDEDGVRVQRRPHRRANVDKLRLDNDKRQKYLDRIRENLGEEQYNKMMANIQRFREGRKVRPEKKDQMDRVRNLLGEERFNKIVSNVHRHPKAKAHSGEQKPHAHAHAHGHAHQQKKAAPHTHVHHQKHTEQKVAAPTTQAPAKAPVATPAVAPASSDIVTKTVEETTTFSTQVIPV